MAILRFSVGLCLTMACWTSVFAQQYTISTFAGNGTSGFTGDSGAASSAQLSFPNSIAFDSNGNMYIADTDNHRVRMVSSGTITTIAGNGTAGFMGDGKAATSAELDAPTGVFVDKSGNIYIADSLNNVVREVTSGNINTIAGSNSAGAGYTGDLGTATDAQLSNPVAVVVDSSGNIYIADSSNNVIREVVAGYIYTIVGSSATPFIQLIHPDGLALDSAGNLYIADTGNRRILKYSGGFVTPGTTTGGVTSAGVVTEGVVTEIAGSGNVGFTGDYGLATNASLDDSTGLLLDSAGNIYIADTFNSRIRRITTDGIISTIAGNGYPGYFGDGGSAVSASLNFPHAVAIDSSGKIYIADTSNSTIRVLTPQAPTVTAGSVVNAATFAAPVSPGSLASVFGSMFTGGKGGANLPLPSTLAGTSITVNSVPAPLLYVSPGQINFQIPWETQPGNATVVVSNGLTSNTVTVQVLGASPGLFVQSSGRAIVQNSDYSLNTAGNPGKEGLPIIAYLTGSGPVSPAVADGAAAPTTAPFAVLTSSYSASIGGTNAQVVFAGLAPGFVGLVQMNIIVPTGLSKGDYPLVVSIGGQKSNGGTISVTP